MFPSCSPLSSETAIAMNCSRSSGATRGEGGEPALERSARDADGLGDLVDRGTLGVLLEGPNDLLGTLGIGGSGHGSNVARSAGSRHLRARIMPKIACT